MSSRNSRRATRPRPDEASKDCRTQLAREKKGSPAHHRQPPTSRHADLTVLWSWTWPARPGVFDPRGGKARARAAQLSLWPLAHRRPAPGQRCAARLYAQRSLRDGGATPTVVESRTVDRWLDDGSAARCTRRQSPGSIRPKGPAGHAGSRTTVRSTCPEVEGLPGVEPGSPLSLEPAHSTIVNSTRRLFSRPADVLFVSTGFVCP
jgi:hypothetical protein